MTLRIGVLGVGRIGKMHAELAARQVPGASLAMVQDINAQAASAIATDLDVPYTTDVDELLESGDVDAVAICSSTDTHVPLMIAAAAAGKAIFCEKPVSLDLAKVDEGLAAVRSAAVPIQIGFNRRFDAAHARCAPRWSTDPSATCTSCASPVVIRHRHRSPTSRCRVVCSST